LRFSYTSANNLHKGNSDCRKGTPFPMAGVTIEHLSKTFFHHREEKRAVDDLSLAVADGELMALVGPSGCGKTTTLRLIAGLDDPSDGVIQIGGRVVNRIAPRNRDVAMVFQNLALYPHMTVFDNMAFGLRMRRLSRADIVRKVHAAAAILGIEALLTRRPAALSGGEQQRVALGRAIVREPKVFLFDEPLSGLDASMRVQMRREIKSLHQALGTTVIHVTHDQEEAMTLGDRVAVLRDGRLLQVGTPLDVYRRPVNRFVAQFLGTPPMNLIEGTIERDGDGAVFISRLGRLALPDGSRKDCCVEPSSTLTLGIRPEHIIVGTPVAIDDQIRDRQRTANSSASDDRNVESGIAGSALSGPILVRLRFTEQLGDRAYLHLVGPGEQELIARFDGSALPRAGESVTIHINFAKAHWFSADGSARRL
jgi:multiple sugar transport system ATP-binding protein